MLGARTGLNDSKELTRQTTTRDRSFESIMRPRWTQRNPAYSKRCNVERPRAGLQFSSIGSEDVNEYLQRITGHPFTAKDFRTWAGTVLAARALGTMEEVDSKTLAKRNIITAIEAVARLLGNTAAICRKCYIHPAIPTSYLDGTLARTLRRKADAQIAQHLHELKPEEAAVIGLLRQELAKRSEKPSQMG
jgi:DNA topoisomerase IB